PPRATLFAYTTLFRSTRSQEGRTMNKPRVERREVHGWIALDKAVGETSTNAVAALKRMFRAKKAGHAGTLDPLASGILPVAFGEDRKSTRLNSSHVKI